MFKRIRTAGIVILALIFVYAETAAQHVDQVAGSTTSSATFAPSELLVRFHPSTEARQVDRVLIEHGAARSRRIDALGVDVLRLPAGLSVERAVEVFSRLPEVEFAEPNYILRVLAPPQEIDDQWGLLRIRAPEAWDLIESRVPVLIAVTDTGIDRTHSDLAPNIWQNPGEVPGNGVDDDANGYVDDTWGWDFANGDNDPVDDNNHGTIVSSVAAGVQDGSGVAGVCPWCTVAAVKVLAGNGTGTLDAVANGIVYAADIGARVINLSLGASFGAQTLEDAVNYAWGQGALVVAAAGNEGVGQPFYPAGYANAMAVASTTVEDYHSCFSNFAEGYVSVGAPGEAIASALPGQEYGSFNGTSLSTPHVSGLAGLLFSQDPTRTNAGVRGIIEATADDLGPAGNDAHFGAGRINAYRAVAGDTSPTTPPAGLFSDDLTASGYAHARKLARDANGTLHLAWHSRDGNQYRVLYAASGDGGATWSAPEIVFASSAETFHPALAVDGEYVFVVFPSKDNSTVYRVLFTRRPLAGGGWAAPAPLTGTAANAVRPDIYRDPSNGRLHVVASSLDDAPFVTYVFSDDMGASWSAARQVNVAPAGQQTRYAAVYANGSNVVIAGRTLERILQILPIYRVFAIRSADGGETWGNSTVLSDYLGILSGEYGASPAGAGDRQYLAYEDGGAIIFRRSDNGGAWSAAENLGTGAWPSITQRDDGQAWLMWESEGSLLLRRYDGSTWEPAETVFTATSRSKAYYPNLKLGASANRIEWAATHCSGSPYRLMTGWRFASRPEGNTVFLPIIIK